MHDQQIAQFFQEVINSTLENNSKLLICGTNRLGLLLVKELTELGLEQSVIGWYDPITSSQKEIIKGKRVFSIQDLNTEDFDEAIITYDKEKETIISKIQEIQQKNFKIRLIGNKNYDFDDPVFNSIFSSLQVKSIAAGYPEMLIHIFQSLLYIEQSNVPGDLVELGTYKGGTTVFMAKVLRQINSSRTIYSFDTFEGFPGRKSSLDIFDDKKYGNVDYEEILRYCEPYNIKLIKGDINSTIDTLPTKQVAFSFFDTDNYSATKKALDVIFPKTPKGGIFAFDHYHSREWVRTVGERIAAKEMLSNGKAFNLYGTGIFIKQ